MESPFSAKGTRARPILVEEDDRSYAQGPRAPLGSKRKEEAASPSRSSSSAAAAGDSSSSSLSSSYDRPRSAPSKAFRPAAALGSLLAPLSAGTELETVGLAHSILIEAAGDDYEYHVACVDRATGDVYVAISSSLEPPERTGLRRFDADWQPLNLPSSIADDEARIFMLVSKQRARDEMEMVLPSKRDAFLYLKNVKHIDSCSTRRLFFAVSDDVRAGSLLRNGYPAVVAFSTADRRHRVYWLMILMTTRFEVRGAASTDDGTMHLALLLHSRRNEELASEPLLVLATLSASSDEGGLGTRVWEMQPLVDGPHADEAAEIVRAAFPSAKVLSMRGAMRGALLGYRAGSRAGLLRSDGRYVHVLGYWNGMELCLASFSKAASGVAFVAATSLAWRWGVSGTTTIEISDESGAARPERMTLERLKDFFRSADGRWCLSFAAPPGDDKATAHFLLEENWDPTQPFKPRQRFFRMAMLPKRGPMDRPLLCGGGTRIAWCARGEMYESFAAASRASIEAFQFEHLFGGSMPPPPGRPVCVRQIEWRYAQLHSENSPALDRLAKKLGMSFAEWIESRTLIQGTMLFVAFGERAPDGVDDDSVLARAKGLMIVLAHPFARGTFFPGPDRGGPSPFFPRDGLEIEYLASDGAGALLVDFAKGLAFRLGYRRLNLRAVRTAVGFYLRQGLRTKYGTEYEEFLSEADDRPKEVRLQLASRDRFAEYRRWAVPGAGISSDRLYERNHLIDLSCEITEASYRASLALDPAYLVPMENTETLETKKTKSYLRTFDAKSRFPASFDPTRATFPAWYYDIVSSLPDGTHALVPHALPMSEPVREPTMKEPTADEDAY